MKRNDFIKNTLGGLLAIVGLSKVKAEEIQQEGHVFNVKKLKERLDYLKKYPLTPEEAFSQRTNLQRFRSWYQSNDSGISFHAGEFKTTDPDLIKSLLNHPACKK